MPAAPVIFNRVRYAHGLGYNFTLGTAIWILVDSGAGSLWTPSPTDDFVASMLIAGAVEAAVTGDRQPITNPTVTLDGAHDRALWGADSFTYPGVANATTFDTLVLANVVTNDSDSWLMGAWDQGPLVGDGNPITCTVGGGYLFAW